MNKLPRSYSTWKSTTEIHFGLVKNFMFTKEIFKKIMNFLKIIIFWVFEKFRTNDDMDHTHDVDCQGIWC
jgi:hypothetical protein